MRVRNVFGVLLGLLLLTACPPPPPPPPADSCKDVSCGDHGSCDAETGSCDCDAAYSGDSCDVFDCATLSCGDHGSCDATTASCQCSGNWEGELCDSAIPLEIVGDYVDGWGFEHRITESTWTTMGSVFNISQADNSQNFLIAQNDSANAYNPDLWSRFDWFVDGDAQLYYCQTAFDAASEDAALATAPADSADLEAGCGGYGWSSLDIALSIRGGYVDGWDFNHFVRQDSWTMPGATDSVFHIRQFDNDARTIIAQNDSANPYNPDLWSRFDWTHNSDGGLFYCQTAFDAASEDAALATAPADFADLAAGCGGYAWSPLEPLRIAGDYSDASSAAVSFGAFAFSIGSDSFAIETFSNSSRTIIAQNGSSNATNADLYSRFDWFVDGAGDLFLCDSVSDAADRAAALAATAADSADLATGCKGSAWTALAPAGG